MDDKSTVRGLGDIVAHAFATVGITKGRAQAAASAVGLDDCGCDHRQQAMNEWGAKYLGIGTTAPHGPPAPPLTVISSVQH